MALLRPESASIDVHGKMQDTNRMSFKVNISTRDWVTMHQPAFEAAVEAGVTSVMCSYNEINGVPACANKCVLQSHTHTHTHTHARARSISLSLSLSLPPSSLLPPPSPLPLPTVLGPFFLGNPPHPSPTHLSSQTPCVN